MASTSELARKLARRRAGEQVFEKVATQSSADAVASYGGGVRMEGGSETVFESVSAASHADAAYSQEATTPVHNSAAFAAALEKIRAFERARDAQGHTSGSSVRSRTSQDDSHTARTPAADKTESDSAAHDVGTQRRQGDFKSAVRERFAALIREGVAPNEAAARAICEAAGQQAEVEGASSGTILEGAQRSCASSARGPGKFGKKSPVSAVA